MVTLSSGNPAATLPASVTVSAGSTSATFTITTGGSRKPDYGGHHRNLRGERECNFNH